MITQIEREMQLGDILERTGFNEKARDEVDYDIDTYLNNRW